MITFRKYIVGYLLTAICSLIPFTMSGETVSQKEASRLAQTFFNAANGQVVGKPNLVYNGKSASVMVV